MGELAKSGFSISLALDTDIAGVAGEADPASGGYTVCKQTARGSVVQGTFTARCVAFYGSLRLKEKNNYQ